jgi:small-conductance mechanosensitive channel
MPETIQQQTEELERLERAAEESNRPEDIPSAAARPHAAVEARVSKLWFLSYFAVGAVLGAAIFLLDWQGDIFRPQTAARIHRYLLGTMGVLGLIAGAKAVDVYAISRLRNTVSRFNLRRILRLAIGIAIVFIAVSVLFVNWYTAVVSLGLISLILGFALQTPISSFIGWIYILARAPYRVGDRIQIGDARGDVIDVSYLDTTLWEIGGRHLSTDHPSGRLIKFPNTNVFSTPVFNYSWPLFPYVWNEIKLSIAYESDLEFVATTMQKLAEEELGESMMEKVKLYRDLLARTPVDDLQVQERPVVVFRINPNTWLDAIVRYLVHPKQSGPVKTRLTRKLLAALNSAPEKVLFPKSNLR